jgi:hypothetical protein
MKLRYNEPLHESVRITPVRASTDQATVPRGGAVDPPANLRMWFCDSALIRWIEQELNSLQRGQIQPSPAPPQSSENNTTSMLSVLVFGYASLIFGSDEIAGACRSDPAFQRLCQGHAPFPHELRSFRRHNRSALERILTGVLAQAIMRKFGLGSALLPVELNDDLRKHAAERLDLARHMDTNMEW